MTKRHRRFGVVGALALALVASACENDLTEINTNPNNPANVPLNNLLLGGVRDVAQNSAERGVFGKWTMLYHGLNWAQHVAQPVYNDEDFYIPRSGIPDLIWDEMYFALADLNDAKVLADESGDDNAWAVAEIMLVYGFHVLTDYFGAIPYSEALTLEVGGGQVAPAYEEQSVIYPDLIARLDAAEARITPGATGAFGDYDPVYQGDMDGWLRFANSLQLRLAMRLSNAASTAAAAAFASAWASPTFTSVAEEAELDWAGYYPAANPVYEGIVYAGRQGDFRLSESLVDRLAAFSDPRLPIYAQPAPSDGLYRGLRNGLMPSEYTPVRLDSDFSPIGAYFLEPTTPSDLLSYAEVLFLGAEAAELGWIGDDAETLYLAGITAAMTDAGVAPGDIATYLAQPEVDYQTGIYAGLDAIHVQKWISLFMAGPEAFADLRRVGWDWTTDPATTGTDLVPAENSDIGPVFPSRLYYPSNEVLVNPNPYNEADPYIDEALWWMP